MTDNLRTSILVEDGENGQMRVKLTRTPGGGAGSGKTLAPLTLTLALDRATEEIARGYGRELHRTLCREPDLKRAVNHLLRAPSGDVWPICFKIEGKTGVQHELAWEALWVKGKEFLALQPQWPIARVVDSESTARVYQAPLHVMAVMSAWGVSAREDWEAIRAAAEQVRASGLPIRVTAVVGELDLLAELQDLVRQQQQNGDTWLTVAGLDSQQTIDHYIRERPHVLHFFCHGQVGYGGGALSMATASDRAEVDEPIESVRVDLNRLKKMVNGSRLWLVTLNCCSGGRSAGPIQSLAQITVEAGAGAALGWRTPVAPGDAHLLCQTVYSSLFRQLRDQLGNVQTNDTVSLELAALGYDLRYALREKHRDMLTWALPVLYVAPEPLDIMVAAAAVDNPRDLTQQVTSEEDERRIAGVVWRQILREAMATNHNLAGELEQRLAAAGPGLDLDEGGAGEP